MSLVIIGSIIAFLTTEMDDLFSLVVLFSHAKSTKEKIAIVVGKYLGLSLMVVGSAFFSVYISQVPSHWLGFLGLIPILFGIKYALKYKKMSNSEKSGMNPSDKGENFFLMAGLSFIIALAAGGDNIAIYISFFTALEGLGQFVVSAIVFAFMQAVWFVLIWLLMNVKSLKNYIVQSQRILIPVLFIILGIYIFLQNGTLLWLLGK